MELDIGDHIMCRSIVNQGNGIMFSILGSRSIEYSDWDEKCCLHKVSNNLLGAKTI